MAAYGRKRVYASRGRTSRMAKRRRTTRRPARRRGYRSARGRTTAFTSKAQGAYNDQVFRARRLSKKSWRSALYRETQTKVHYRSIFTSDTFTVTAPLGMSTQKFNAVQCLINPLTSAGFWVVGGGAISTDAGISVPDFDSSSIVLRGGMLKLSCTLDDNAVNVCRVRIWLVWSRQRPLGSQITTLTGSNWPIMYRPNDQPDFMQLFGRIMLYREAMLDKNQGVEVNYRLRPMKLDETVFSLGGNVPYWIVSNSQMNDRNAATETVACVASHSLSFSADAIT